MRPAAIVQILRIPCPQAAAKAVQVQAAAAAEREGRQVVYSAVVWRHGVAVVSVHTRERVWRPVVVLERAAAAEMQQSAAPELFVA